MATGAVKPGSARTIKASEFKAKCLKLMDEVAVTGEGHHHHQERQAGGQAIGAPRKAQDALWHGQGPHKDHR